MIELVELTQKECCIKQLDMKSTVGGAQIVPKVVCALKFVFLSHVCIAPSDARQTFVFSSQSQKYMEDFIMDEWLRMERELTRERGLWGPDVASR